MFSRGQTNRKHISESISLTVKTQLRGVSQYPVTPPLTVLPAVSSLAVLVLGVRPLTLRSAPSPSLWLAFTPSDKSNIRIYISMF